MVTAFARRSESIPPPPPPRPRWSGTQGYRIIAEQDIVDWSRTDTAGKVEVRARATDTGVLGSEPIESDRPDRQNLTKHMLKSV